MAHGLITPFQSNLLLQGRFRGFFIRNKYKLLDLLGVGGMGRVFLCEHVLLRRLVAVKVLSSETMRDQAMVERFYREARAVAALDHPNIVRVHDVEQDDKMPLMVMEFVDGASLQSIVKRSGVLSPERAAHYIAQAALGLQHAHEQGLVHRDIKPGNLLLDRSGTIKILDLGLARFFRSKEDSVTDKYDEKIVFGTADYLAPEQAIDSSDVDIRADIYSLGATMYFILTGEPPFGEGSIAQKLLAHQTKPVPSIRKRRPDIPIEIEAIIDRMMAKSPDDRYAIPAEVAEALAPWAALANPAPTSMELNPLPLAIAQLLQNKLASAPHTPPPSQLLRVDRLAQRGANSAVIAPTAPTTDTMQNASETFGRRSTVMPGVPTAVQLPAGHSTSGMLAAVPMESGISPAPTIGNPPPAKTKAQKGVPLIVAAVVIGIGILGGLLAAGVFKSSKPSPAEQAKADAKTTSTTPPSTTSLRPTTQGAISPEDARNYIDQEATVEFVVNRFGATATKDPMFLNSMEDFRDPKCFTVVIYKATAEMEFPGKDYEDIRKMFEGKRVRVRGKITIYRRGQGPQIELKSKDQIEVIGDK